MSQPMAKTSAVFACHLQKTFRRKPGVIVRALQDVSLEVRPGVITAIVGPDGAGKTTLLRLVAGLMTADSGELSVLGFDVARSPQQVQNRISYMPQRFGLYADLTVQENLNLYADLHGVSVEERNERYPRLMEMTALARFVDRRAGRLSGGMKQKLGLACTLVRSPDLLLLDEPTVGVDPLSRRELWAIIQQLAEEQGLTVLLSTSYLDEAAKCADAIVMHEGSLLAQGDSREVSRLAEGKTVLVEPSGQTARSLQGRLLAEANVLDAAPEGGHVRLVLTDQQAADALRPLTGGLPLLPTPPRFEDGFMILLRAAHKENPAALSMPLERPPGRDDSEPVVRVRDLVRKFGDFTAVDHLSFEVRRGEVFGLLGSNGAGKSTTFRMLCGLLRATSGTLRVAGADLRVAQASARQRIGYVAQKFSMYSQLSVIENLEFFCGAYGLRGKRRRERVAWAIEQFELQALTHLQSGQLPGGYKQRLAMAAALMHEPAILFLDEPTSGVDPLARREFWQRITALAEQGVTVIVTTHFMEEAEYCDCVAVMDAGRILAQGTPAEMRARSGADGGRRTMEEAFIGIVEEVRGGKTAPDTDRSAAEAIRVRSDGNWMPAPARRTWSLVRKEAREMFRDPSSIAIGVVLPVLLILLFGYGLSLDVKHVPLAIVIEEPSPDAMQVAARFQASPYFEPRWLLSMAQARRLMLAREIDAIVRVRGDFGRDLSTGDARVQILVHGTDANRARIIESYARRAIGAWAGRRAAGGEALAAGMVSVQSRLWFNSANDSRYFLVPGLIVLIMTLIGAFLTALVMAREWERGTLESLFVTPVRAGEIVLGKTLPNFALGMIGLALCVLTAQFLFHVPFRGSLWLLIVSSMLYLAVALGIGLVISAAVKSQFVASQITILVTFLPALMLSGFLFDLRSMPEAVRIITYLVPARYFVAILQSVFLAGDVWSVILPNALVLAGMAIVLLIAVRLMVRKKLA